MSSSVQAVRARIVALAGYEHPTVRHAPWFGIVEQVAAALAADATFLHSTVGDPAGLGPELRGRIGGGLLVPMDPDVHANDVAHFARTAPARLQRFVEAIARFAGLSPADAAARPEVMEAISFARSAQALAPSVVVSFGLEHGAFRALAICGLLGTPRVVVLDDARHGDALRRLLPMHVEQAAVVVATQDVVRDALGQRFGADALGKVVSWDAVADPLDGLVDAVRRGMRRGPEPDAPPFGPLAAFTTRPTRPARPPGSRPFVVLGAERTGSNMLMAMLADQPGFACANELFNPRAIAADELSWLPTSALAPGDLGRLRRRDPAGLLAQLGRDAVANGARHHGFKLLYGHALVDDRVTDALVGDPDLRVVHLLRRDRLARWLSMRRAVASDRWLGGERAGDERVPLNVQHTVNDFVFHEVMEGRFRAVFAGHATLELDYDELAADLPACARRLGGFLGVDLGAMAPRTRKTGPASVARAIANLDELRAAFTGTKWEAGIP